MEVMLKCLEARFMTTVDRFALHRNPASWHGPCGKTDNDRLLIKFKIARSYDFSRVLTIVFILLPLTTLTAIRSFHDCLLRNHLTVFVYYTPQHSSLDTTPKTSAPWTPRRLPGRAHPAS